MQAFFRQFGDRLLFGDVDVGHLEQAAFGVAFLEVVHHHIEQRGRQQRAHDGQIGGDGVEDADDIAFRRAGGNVQHVQIGVGIESQRFGLIEALGAHGALGLGAGALHRRQPAAGDLGRLEEGGHDMLVAVLTDHFLRQIGLADLDILAPAGGR